MSNTTNEFWIIEVVPAYFNFRKSRYMDEKGADQMLHEVNAVVWYSGQSPWDERLNMMSVSQSLFGDYDVYDENCFKGQSLYYVCLNDIDLSRIENVCMRSFIEALLDEREWTLQFVELTQNIQEAEKQMNDLTEAGYAASDKMAANLKKLQKQKDYLMKEKSHYFHQKREAQMGFLKSVIEQRLGQVPPQAEALLEKGSSEDRNYWMFALFFAKSQKQMMHELRNPQRMVE